jgi:hypothetical protein
VWPAWPAAGRSAPTAAEAQSRNFYAAGRPALVADGQAYNWTVGPLGAGLATADPRRLPAEALSHLRNGVGKVDYPRYRREGLPATSGLAGPLAGELNAGVKGKQEFWNRPAGGEAVLRVRAALLGGDGVPGRYFAQRPGLVGNVVSGALGAVSARPLVSFEGMRPSKRMAKWFRAAFQPTIGIVHLLAASPVASQTSFAALSAPGYCLWLRVNLWMTLLTLSVALVV